MNDIALLPLELILGYLPAIERIRVARVCRRWAALVRRPEFWRSETYAVRNLFIERCIQRGGDFELLCKQLAFAPYEFRGSAGSWLKIACSAGNRLALTQLLDREAVHDTYTLLNAACGGGHLEIATLLIRHYGLDFAHSERNSLFHAACRSGNVALIRWLSIWLALDSVPNQECIVGVCSAGELASVQWLTNIYGSLKPANACIQLVAACSGGHLHVAQWLVAHHQLTRQEINKWTRITSPLTVACIHGHTTVATWLIQQFGCDSLDFYYRIGSGRLGLVDWACLSGNLELVRELHRLRPLPAANRRVVFTFTAKDPEFRIPQWLTVQYQLDFSQIDYSASLDSACRADNLGAVQWLVANFRQPTDTACSWLEAVGSVPVLGYLAAAYNMSETDMNEWWVTRGAYSANAEFEICRWLVEKFGADLSSKRDLLRRFLKNRIAVSESVEMMQWVDDTIDDFKYVKTATELAARRGYNSVVQLLVGRYRDRLPIEELFTAACKYEHVDIAIYLADHYPQCRRLQRGILQAWGDRNTNIIIEWLKEQVN